MNSKKYSGYYVYNDHTNGYIEHKINITKFFSCFMCTRNPDYSFAGEWHDFWELAVILEGTASVGAGNKHHKLDAGMGILHPPMEFHSIAADADMKNRGGLLRFIIISFDAPEMEIPEDRLFTLPPVFIDILTQMVIDVGYTFKHEELSIENTEYLLRGLLDDPEISPQYFAAAIEMMLSYLISPRLLHKQRLSMPQKNYNMLLNTIHSNIHQCLSIPEIAEMCKFSPDYAKKLFKKMNGEPIIEYYNKVKMDCAKKFMEQGMTVGETARRLGYNDQNYFSRVFKRYAGTTPSQYKKDVVNAKKTPHT